MSKPKVRMEAFYPKNFAVKFVIKTPVLLWRLGCGPLIGRLIMLITTTGSKSGLPRRTPVEYYSLGKQKYVTCGFGAKAAWYKNIRADAHVTIQTSSGTEKMLARRVTSDSEVKEVFQLFRQHDPLLLNWYLQSLDIEPNEDDVVKNKEKIYWITFDLTTEPTPPAVKMDLVWVWLVLLLCIGGITIASTRRLNFEK